MTVGHFSSLLCSLCFAFVLERMQYASAEKGSLPNVLWILLDDISTERFPESGNTALQGLLPGWDRLREDPMTVYYEHFYSPSSLCAPSQVALFSGMEPADIGGQYQLSLANVQGKAPYATVPPPNVQFLPEMLRAMGYWSVAGGKLDYQVADVIPTFYNRIVGNAWSDVTAYQNEVWDPAIAMGRPFFGMINMMDMHQLISTFSREAPITLTNPDNPGTPPTLPFGPFGYAKPMSLVFEGGPNGQPPPGPRPVVRTNVEHVDIIGYEGAFNATLLTHANGGVPGYLPEEIGIQSILAREYDLVRNADYRLGKIIDALQERGVYNDTMIVVFGDHGSATYKGKVLLEPQSLRTPCWIKYPAGTKFPAAVKSRTCNTSGDDENDKTFTYLVDDRMTSLLDLFPTTLSVLGVPPPDWIKAGLPLAGEYAVEQTREVLFALVQRVAEISGWKSFAAFTKNFHYQRNMVTQESIADYSKTIPDDEQLAAALGTVPADSLVERRFDIFAASPIFDRIRRLLRIKAESDPDFVTKYGFIAADDATVPPEVLYDLDEDPFGTRNLIMNYTYTVTLADTAQPWGNNVSKVTVEYGPVNDNELSEKQSVALNHLREALNAWIDTQTWVTPEFVFGEGGFAEENAMAEIFWPGGVQPKTNPVEIVSFDIVADGEEAKANFFARTEGMVIRYSVVSPEGRSACAQLSQGTKDEIPQMTITESGLPLSNYTSLLNSQTYAGYHYKENILLTNLIGEVSGCQFFVSSSATFMEMSCPGETVFAFDTRDSTWNGTTWVGVDANTGVWKGDPVLLFDYDKLTWNPAAFHAYVFGPLRTEIYSGLNPDGSAFVPADGNAGQMPLNMGFDPPPKYWLVDINVTSIPDRIFPTQPIRPSGWSLNAAQSFFKSTQSDSFDDKGSFSLGILMRGLNPSFLTPMSFSFDSFGYDCLLWDVGNDALLSFGDSNGLHVFVQGIRKGYADSPIVESYFTLEDVFESDKSATSTPVDATTAPSIISAAASFVSTTVCVLLVSSFVVLVVG